MLSDVYKRQVGMDFVTDIALSYIAFGVGKYFKFSTLKKSGSKVLTITLFESLTAAIAVIFAMVYVFKLPMSFALLLGAIGCATAPASTIMTIRQYHAKGDFVNTVLQVVALDDAVSLFAFSICAAIAQSLNGQLALDYKVFLIPLVMNLLVVMLEMCIRDRNSCSFVVLKQVPGEAKHHLPQSVFSYIFLSV